MDRMQLFLLGLPLFLFCSDIVNMFTPPPPKPSHQHQLQPQHQHQHQHQPIVQQTLDFPTEKAGGPGAISYGHTIRIDFCSSCSYKGTAVTMKKMLETSIPGIDVVLANYPPPLPKRLLSKVVPIVQVGAVAIVMAGDQIFPRLGFMVPPPGTSLFVQIDLEPLQPPGFLATFCNLSFKALVLSKYIAMVFSKLKEHRFPSEFELKDLVGRKMAGSRIVDGIGGVWS